MSVTHNPMIRPLPDPQTLPTISIVTPCFNHVETVEATLLSVLGQGYPKLEYVVMDGGSTDGSAAVIERHAAHLTHWQSRPDKGQYHAILEGFGHTTGEVMGWINSDDMVHRNALWTVGDVFRTFPEVEWLIGSITGYDPYGRTIWVNHPPPWSRYHYIRKDKDYGFLQQESVFWRRSLWERAGGRLDTSLVLAADFELWMRFFRHGRLYQIPALVGGFRHLPGQRSIAQRAAYLREVDAVVAREPLSDADRRVIRRMLFFERFVRSNPLLKRNRRLRRAYKRLFDYPRLLAYEPETNRFVHVES